MRLTELNYYAALEVLPGAPLDQIERAHRFAMQSYGAGSLAIYGIVDEAERREIEIFLNEAMRILGNEHLRSLYDKRLRENGVYTEVQMRRAAGAGGNIPDLAAADPQLPILPARPAGSSVPVPASAPVPAPVVAESKPVEAAAPTPVETFAAEPKPSRERSWWPFAEKDKAAETAAPQQAAAPAHPAASATSKSVGEDTAPLERPVAQAVISALDGRPIGGGELRQIREARGLRLEEISNRTKISLSTLRAIEDSTFKFLPAPVYLKGFLRTYSKMLQIDADKVIADYMRNFEAHRS